MADLSDDELCEKYGITLDTLDEIKTQFQEFDLDGNGSITTKELGTVFKNIGMDLPQYKVRDLVASIDRDKNGMIEINEFIEMYSDMKSKEIAQTFRQAITKREGIEAKGGTSYASVEGTTHSLSEEEQVAFVDYINSNMADDPDLKDKLPMKHGKELFKSVGDGIMLCKLINLSQPDTIDERAINKGSKLNLYLKHENLTLALNSARAIGCNIVNIGPDDLMRGTEHLVLGLMWQIIRVGLFAKIDLQHNPGLFRLLEEGEDPDQLLKMAPEDLLMRWVNYQMEQAGHPRRIHNFSSDIKDSEVYIHLLKQIAPDSVGLDTSAMQESDHLTRAELMLDNADKIGCRQFVQATDVVSGHSKLNMAFVANLFNMYPALKPPDEGEGDEFERYEETREEKTFRNWMNSLGVNPYVQYLYTDLCNGLVILQLYDMVKPNFVEWSRVTKPPWPKLGGGKMQKIENCNYCVELGQKMRFSLVGIGGNDIHDGVETLTLAVVWQLMRAYTLRILQQLSGADKPLSDDKVIEWCNTKLKNAKKTSSIRSFQDHSISDSRAVVDLIDSIQSGAITYKNFRENPTNDTEKLLNAKYAISMARKIGAPVYALPEDLVEVKPKMVMTVFACLMARGLSKK
ncbi:plastin-3-like [Saccoglossus kowalevskii]|uniref:Plastin-3-like n=1 Tax=Saccoglossus kowalevskii TaxID=10224 RepID=A0ABM0GSV0_SACKO|nr:PREDICTED: plastin-3-like [Saccoglossus kowalevskii]